MAATLAAFARHATGPGRSRTAARWALLLESAARPEVRAPLGRGRQAVLERSTEWVRQLGSGAPERHGRILVDHLEGVVMRQLAFPDGPFDPAEEMRALVGGLLAVPATAVAVTAAPDGRAAAPSRTAPHPASRTARAGVGLDDPAKREIAMQLVSSAENSSLDWKAQYKYIEDIGDGRGYTGGIIGFTSGTHDMLELVELYTQRKPDNVLAKYLPALRKVDGSDSHDGLDPDYPEDWRTAAQDPDFRKAQDDERDRVYFDPAVEQGKADGVGVLGQFAYYDALVMHGSGDDPASFPNIRRRALAEAKPPAQGGDEKTYLNAFLDARVWAMKQEKAHSDTSRVDTEQRVFLGNGNLDLHTPLDWKVYGESYHIG
ncbi:MULTISPECIES: chitosanase [unclassified Streptomyces]|uniref:chitosanase n=1 Tax=unclassified Streptomyces TaxID=2593676 RepID=UPI0022773441|nr:MULTISPECIES: chitosanase [unclassified Streptomyces]